MNNFQNNEREQLIGEFIVAAQAVSVEKEENVSDEMLRKCNGYLDVLLRDKTLKVTELTLVASFRYALGRRTYIVTEVVDDILINWDKLSRKFKDTIAKEIKEAIENNNAGDQMDIQEWNKILDFYSLEDTKQSLL